MRYVLALAAVLTLSGSVYAQTPGEVQKVIGQEINKMFGADVPRSGTAPTDGQVWTYDGTSKTWKAKDAGGGGGPTTSNLTTVLANSPNPGVTGGTSISLTSGDGLISAAGALTRVGGKVMTTDSVPDPVLVMGSSALATAVTNRIGGNSIFSSGIGTKSVTVTAFATLASDSAKLGMTINGHAIVVSLVAGTNWTAATSNNATATSLASAINGSAAGPYVTATAVAATVSISPKAGTYTIRLNDDGNTSSTGWTFVGASYWGNAGHATGDGYVTVANSAGDGNNAIGPIVYYPGYASDGSNDLYFAASFGSPVFFANQGPGGGDASNTASLSIASSSWTDEIAGSGTGNSVSMGWDGSLFYLGSNTSAFTLRSAGTTAVTIDASQGCIFAAVPRFNATQGTGAGTVTIGVANSPATGTVAAWIPVKLSDGSTAYLAAWKP